jgi:hypothetical protein
MLSVRVCCVALVIPDAQRMRVFYFHIWLVRMYNIFQHYLNYWKNIIGHRMCYDFLCLVYLKHLLF